MDVFALDPLADPRWDDLLQRHPCASLFHSRGWLEALKRTYGYEPIALSTTAQGPLDNGLVSCRITGWPFRRVVSLPFSDHCDPLVDQPDQLSAMLAFLRREIRARTRCSLELRPRHAVLDGFARGKTFYLHTLDLVRPAGEIFKAFHPSSTQRAIRRAEREGLVYETGNRERLLSAFYGLLRLTRRRHGLPPQPFVWFQNLAACIGDGLNIHVASKDGQPVASILTLSFKKTMVYKYGGSDPRYHRFGSMPFLFWRAIEAAKARGIEEMDLGRSDLDQPGLVTFKDHLGAVRSTLTYYTEPRHRRNVVHASPIARAARMVVAHLPNAALDLTGRLLYKHLG